MPRNPGKKAKLGSSVHKVLECLALLKQQKQNLINKIESFSKEKFPTLNKQEIVDDCLDRNILNIKDKSIGEFSCPTNKLNNKPIVDHLIKLSFDYFSLQEKDGFTKKDFIDVEKWVYTVLHYSDGVFDPRKRDIVAAEPHFDYEIPYDWAAYDYKMGDKELKGQLSIKGTIDLITKINDETIEIIDWKTGSRKNWATNEEKTYEKLCRDPQLMLYYYAARKMYPWAKNIILTIYWIRDGGPFTICFDNSVIKEMEDILKERFEYVKSVKVPKMVSPTQSDFRCTKICGYYKNKWPGTNINQCRFIHDKIVKHGIDYVQLNFMKEGHQLSHYENPGE